MSQAFSGVSICGLYYIGAAAAASADVFTKLSKALSQFASEAGNCISKGLQKFILLAGAKHDWHYFDQGGKREKT